MSSEPTKSEENDLPDDVKAIVAKVQTNKDKWLTDNAKVVRIQSSLLLLSVLLSIFFLKGKSFFNLIFLVMFGSSLFTVYSSCRPKRKLLLCSGEDFERLEASAINAPLMLCLI